MDGDTFKELLSVPGEDEHIEFKEAKNQYSVESLLEYCVAFANEGGGKLVLGVTNNTPRQVVGTRAFSGSKLVEVKQQIIERLHIWVDVDEILHEYGRVLVFKIPSRPTGLALEYKGAYLMRSGGSLVSMTSDRLNSIFAEDVEDWFQKTAIGELYAEQVIDLLDTQIYFQLIKLPYAETQKGVLERLLSNGLVEQRGDRWGITNMGAILLAKDLERFPTPVARKAPRFVIYDGNDKLNTREDIQGRRGYAVGFESLVELIHQTAPQNRIVEETVREEVKMFPLQAIRELVANALIHQDFTITGTSVMIEMYSDRLEISNPGKPPIEPERFIDEEKSRNERLAHTMRQLGICEEKGSGIDKVVDNVEAYQLPAPVFRVQEIHTRVVLFAYQEFSEMTRADRIRACYQHCCLRYVYGQQMSNHSLRKRFNLEDDKMATASQVITATKNEGLIKPDYSESMSTRHIRYVPFWV